MGEEFKNFSGRVCRVANRLITDGLIRRTPESESVQTRRFIEPNTRMAMQITGHMSELLNGQSQSLAWEQDFIKAVEERLREGATWKVV